MSTNKPATRTQENWTNAQAYILATFCLVLGIALGYLFRGSASQPVATTVPATAATTSQSQPQITAEQQKAMVDQAAAPFLATLKNTPEDFATLTKLGNLYYDGQQFSEATKYYERALKIQPQNADVLTDYGTSLWYTGNVDDAIREFNLALKYQPGRASTLFNLGIVRWQGKKDPNGAVQAWEQLLKSNPDYPDKQKLQEFIDRAKQHAKS
jgi:cytochrome c-type biogenesis protein CcmH/NrfG